MRISTDPFDISFSPFAISAFVTLDGEKVSLCVIADEEEGIVTCVCVPYVKDGGDLKRHTRQGEVKITFPNPSLRADAEEWVADPERARN